MKKYFLSILGSTIIWYLFLYIFFNYLVKGVACAHVITTDINSGLNWPNLLPTACVRFGGPIAASVFLQQLFLILPPAIIILILYGVRKLEKKQ